MSGTSFCVLPRLTWSIPAGADERFHSPGSRPTKGSFFRPEQITLAHVPDGRHIVYGQDEIYYIFGPALPDGAARLIAIEDQLGRRIEFQRNGAGRLEAISGGGHRLRLQYGHANSLIRVELLEGGTPRTLAGYEYDGYNRLTSVTDQTGRVVRRFFYEADSTLMSGHSNALGFACGYRWAMVDGQPRVVEERTNEGELYRFAYDPANRQTWVEDTFGNRAHWRYDERANVIENTWFDGRASRFEYDKNDNLVKLYLAGERTVSLEYDGRSRLVAETDPLRRMTRNEYDGESLRITRQTMPDGARWEAHYDYRGLLLAGKDPLGRETQYDYGVDGLPDIVIDPNGGENRLEWDKLGNITVFSDSSGKTTRYEYDADGNLTAVVDAAGNRTTIQCNGDGAPVRITRPDRSQQRFDYLPTGLMSSRQDGAGKARQWEYNTRGQIVRTLSPARRGLSYRYDQHGRLAELTNGNGGSTRFAYDAGGRLVLEIGFDQIEKHYRYDAAGFLIAAETHARDDSGNAVKREMRLERDAAGRLTGRHTETAVTTYEYDPLDRLLSATRTPTEAGKKLGIVNDSVKFTYDAAGRVIAEEGANGRLSYALDELGNVVNMTLPQGQQLKMLRSATGHVRQLLIGDELLSEIGRDDLHREILRTQGGLSTTFVFDGLGRRTWQGTSLPAAQNAMEPPIWRTYRYDLGGELMEQEDRRRGRQQFRYDDEGLLLSRTRRQDTEQFTWDDAGNLCPSGPAARDMRGATVHDDRVKVWQDIRLTYDAFGNVATKKKGSWFEQRFEYDAENRLMAVHSTAHRSNTTTLFSYDAVGRRIGKTVRETQGTEERVAERETRFVWQGLHMVQEQSAGDLRSYVYEPGGYTPMVHLDQVIQADGGVNKGTLCYYHTDQIGAPLELTDSAGNVVWSGDYSAWGKLLNADRLSGATSTMSMQSLRYQGQYADESTGLHYNTFRYYDPDIGRFMTQDPIGLEGGMNSYQYAPNPLSWIDPWGWASVDYGQMPNIPGYQKHHIVPQNLDNHPTIIESGYDVNNSRNIAYLPNDGAADPARTVHRGMHTGDYNRMMRDNLNDIHSMKASPEIKKLHIEALQDKVGNELRTGKRKLNSAC